MALSARLGERLRWHADSAPSVALVVSISLACTLVIGLADYLTGPYLFFATFYLLPVSLTAWFVGRRAAIGISVLATSCGVVSTALDPGELTAALYLTNGAIRLVTYAFVAFVVAAGRTTIDTVRDLASTDPLTALSNRRRFYEQAAAELTRAQRTGMPLAIVYIDLDGLKEANDTLGHEAGDELIVEFATTARSTLRATDLCGRLGGDEFCLLLPGADVAEAESVLVRLRSRLDRTGVATVTFSAGLIAGTVEPGLEVDAVVRSADRVMLAAKAAGKARVVSRSGLSAG